MKNTIIAICLAASSLTLAACSETERGTAIGAERQGANAVFHGLVGDLRRGQFPAGKAALAAADQKHDCGDVLHLALPSCAFLRQERRPEGSRDGAVTPMSLLREQNPLLPVFGPTLDSE